MTKRALTILAVFIFLPVLVVTLTGGALFWPIEPKESEVTIEKGMTLKEIAGLLYEKGILRFPNLFQGYAALRRAQNNLKAGLYAFLEPVSPHQILEKLIQGDMVQEEIRIVEGETYDEIGRTLAELPFNHNPNFYAEFLGLGSDPKFIQGLGISSPTLEGYLFPDTYRVSPKLKPNEYIQLFVNEYFKVFDTEMVQRSSDLEFTPHQTLTLASMIEKETGNPKEREIISSVFHNRLKKKMVLQSDPTVIYGLKNFLGDLKKSHLVQSHPYNTYIRQGLPPGPICNPGLASIRAALWPTQTDYLFFVSKNDGTHYFSKTAEEHAAAVRQYQRKD